MVIMHIMGGLGNQLFQYAFGRYVAHKLNTEFKLDLSTCRHTSNLHHNYYRLGEFNIVENIATPEEIKSARIFKEDDVKDINEILNYSGNIYLFGYWGLEKYFIDIRDILLQELTLKNPLGKNSAVWRDKILSANCAVSLHVRMGDFLLSLIRKGKMISYDFYEKSIAELKKENPNLTVFVFSDDLDWCKENLKFDVPTEFVEGCESADEEMHLMSLCKHNIVANNSTFSWWGAWLNKNPDKKVFLLESDKMLNHAVNIFVGKNARPLINFPPNLSIIVYIENNPANINLTLACTLNQIFADYEIILADPSADCDEEISRQKIENISVTTLTLNYLTKKVTAWNKALDIARGEYILFLSTKNFIFEYVSKMVAQILYDYLKLYLEPQGKYLYASNYGDDFPNIICSTKILAEDAGGNIVINVIPNKFFSLKTDASLTELNSIAELNLTAEQKLMGLATKGVNNFVATKFFKRQFLIDNKITFNEKMGGVRTRNYSSLSIHFWRRKKLCSRRKFSVGGLNS